jgi:lipopolysaccharide/colanic/teichoic acid biosynthesis glycosyltransferase
MRLIVIRERQDGGADAGLPLLRYALCTRPLADVVCDGLRHFGCCQSSHGPAWWARWAGWTRPSHARWAIPASWQSALAAEVGAWTFYADGPRVDLGGLAGRRAHPWVVISEGRFATCLNGALLEQMLADTSADVVAVMGAADLLAGRERVRLTRTSELVGYRRLYADALAALPMPADWPHHLFVRTVAAPLLFGDGVPPTFAACMERCRMHGLQTQSVAVAGSVLDLESESGLLALCRVALRHPPGSNTKRQAARGPRIPVPDDGRAVSPLSRLIGPVLLGRQVTVEPGAVIVGPSILCDNSRVGRGAVIDSAIVGADVAVEAERVIRRRVVAGATAPSGAGGETGAPTDRWRPGPVCLDRDRAFRVWPRLSYARCGKRLADILVAGLVLVLFAPIIPFLALAIKFSSPGPVFFRDKRQGLHGKTFRCIKFRTMREGADQMQEKLRFVSEVDGPQFKMADDPRITTVGRFLRETYLDEIPQFLNVLRGQMSVVGPRPSPEAENTLCPLWRDARLSVRPGITGLWQVSRTREAHRDFQEWIHYDTRYVRELSPALDLWICWRTFRRMVENFISQF